MKTSPENVERLHAEPNAPEPNSFESVELMRPLLPEAKHITPYLERIDKARWYSNLGPLVQELQMRLGQYYGVDAQSIVTASSATAGLISVLRAMNLPKDSYCLVPSWTFVASPASALAAEMTPYFVDVDNETWAMDPNYVKSILKTVKGVIGAIIVVAPYGRQIDLAAWDKFSAETSIPVVVDAAAGFDCFTGAKFGKTPVVISLHATKIVGAGEAGFIISKDQALLRHVQEQTNFGFYTRHISTPGINSKMSEYTAAVALAALDVWPERRERYKKLVARYIELFTSIAKKHKLVLGLDKDKYISTFSIRLPYAKADYVISQLQVRGVKARQWWDKGCHNQPAYAKYPRSGDLPVTNAIANSIVALPYYIDIPDAHIAYVAKNLDEVLSDMA